MTYWRLFKKLAPYGADGRLFATDVSVYLPTSKSRDTKTRINTKNPVRTNLDTLP